MMPEHGFLMMALSAPDVATTLNSAVASIAIVVTSTAGAILLVQALVGIVAGEGTPSRAVAPSARSGR
jgi:hypothetical protein